jgi:Tfp pilus assembly protein FimV
VRPQYLVLFMVFAGYLVFQTWAEHRLDTLRRERVEFEERIVSTRSALAEARREIAQESEQSRIVARARQELGFIDAEVGGRPRICMPAVEAPAEEPLLMHLARGLDRFGGIRDAFAGEGDR